jgi:hypothetical protein
VTSILHRAVSPRHSRTLVGVLSAVLLVGLVSITWPRPADAAVLQTYAQLEQSSVPVKVIGWIQPTAASAQILPDGYVYRVHAEQLGDLTISGRRGTTPASPGQLAWQEGDVTYTLEATADQQLVQPRVIPLAAARDQLVGGSRWETPMLYLAYLPAFAAFTVWAARSLLLASVPR